MDVRIQAEAFDPGAESNRFLVASAGAGAAVTFTGLVRSSPEEPIHSLMLECHVELAINQVRAIVDAAATRFGLLGAAVIHRYGVMGPGEPIVQVMVLAPHRDAAFKGAEFLMDYLKTDAPFWKKQTTASGANWIEAQDADAKARARWAAD